MNYEDEPIYGVYVVVQLVFLTHFMFIYNPYFPVCGSNLSSVLISIFLHKLYSKINARYDSWKQRNSIKPK